MFSSVENRTCQTYQFWTERPVYIRIWQQVWSGGGVSGIESFVEEIGWEKIDLLSKRLTPKDAEFTALSALGKETADRLNADFSK